MPPHAVSALAERVRGRYRGLTAPDTAQASTAHAQIKDSSNITPLTGSAICPGHGIATLEFFTEPVVNLLLDYYGNRMAPIMTWIDSPYNGWRRLILPLAASQPILRLSILASAAAHAPFDTGVSDELLGSASETAIMMITQRLTQLNEQNASHSLQYDADSTEMLAIIAAVLVLSDYSLLRSDPSVAQFHREGIRTLLNALTGTTCSEPDISAFLRDEAAAYDVLACTSIFQLDRIRDIVLPSTRNGIFADFLRLIHTITISSAQQSGGEHNVGEGDDDQQECPSSMMELEGAFEAARGATLLAGGLLLESESAISKHDFVFLVAAYHHAGLLYAHKRHSCLRTEQTKLCYHLDKLFEFLERIRETRNVLGGLTWPLFIAGICCGDDADHIQKLDSQCQLLAKHTRYEHYNLMWKFLRELHHGPQHDWTLLAKQYESQGQPIIPI